MKIKTSELTGEALDWAVAKCEGMSNDMLHTFEDGEWLYAGSRRYSTDWAQGGPIIEREKLGVWTSDGLTWHSRSFVLLLVADGPTPLTAALRCYVASKLGDEVEVPDELA